MRVSYNWLKEYVEINIPPVELADKLTMAGLEVDKVEYLAEGIDKVIVGRVLKIETHPNAENLFVCIIDGGQANEKLQIVTGAQNIEVGNLVPVALEGAVLPNDISIEKASFKGITSFGMLCSAEELKLDRDTSETNEEVGVLILEDDATPGMAITEYLGLDDYVFEIELTPNRSDCLSMLNVAREVAAITGENLKLPTVKTKDSKSFSFTIEIEDKDLSNRYLGLKVNNIKFGSSPRWMQQRLLAAGMRPINGIVDITNYVMLETGQPLHAFDYDTLLGKKIIVRRAKDGETITTLDGVERKLDEEMLVIADRDRPVAIAGVMGGLETEVTDKTKTVLLESAHFNSVSVRQTARKLGLRSEASSRFEKGVDKEAAKFAVYRAFELISKLGFADEFGGLLDIYPVPWEASSLTLRTKRVNKILGVELSTGKIKEILSRLKFDLVEANDEQLSYLIPSYRQDITREIDLIEEVARLYGYNKMPATLPHIEMEPEQKTKLQLFEDKTRSIAIKLGLVEVITYSFINPASFEQLNLPKEHKWQQFIEIANPLSEEQSVMRTTLLPGLLSVGEKNFSRRQRDLGVFELGRVFIPDKTSLLPEERLHFATLLTGSFNPGWSWQEQKFDFYYLKGLIENLLIELMGQSPSFKASLDEPVFHPGRAASIYLAGKKIGVLGEIHPKIQEHYGFNQKVYFANLDIEIIKELPIGKPYYKPVPKFPNISRDMAMLLKEEIESQEVAKIIMEIGGNLVSEYRLFDVYRGAQIPKGYKSLAYGITYQAKDRTLTDNEVTELHEEIKKTIMDRLGAEFR